MVLSIFSFRVAISGRFSWAKKIIHAKDFQFLSAVQSNCCKHTAKRPCAVVLSKHKKLNNTQFFFFSSQYLLSIVVSRVQNLCYRWLQSEEKKPHTRIHIWIKLHTTTGLYTGIVRNVHKMQLENVQLLGILFFHLTLNSQNRKKILWICWFYSICASFFFCECFRLSYVSHFIFARVSSFGLLFFFSFFLSFNFLSCILSGSFSH